MSIQGAVSTVAGALYFKTNNDTEFNENKKAVFLLRTGESLVNYDLDMSKVDTWKDTIAQLRINPVHDKDVKIVIDYIWVHAKSLE